MVMARETRGERDKSARLCLPVPPQGAGGAQDKRFDARGRTVITPRGFPLYLS
jgi:hypothetical protein